MHTRIFVLAAFAAALAMPAAAEEPAKKDDKDAVVKEIDLKGLKLGEPRGNVTKPTAITSEDELAKAIENKDAQAAIKKAVDFKKQYLLFFAWAGSGQDKLDYAVAKGKKGPEVTFKYTAGRTRDLRPHFHLFAIRKDAEWVAPER